jgi:hypothetical protein
VKTSQKFMHPAYDFDIPPRYPVFILLSSSYLRRLGLVFIKSLGLHRQTTYLVMRSFLLSKAIHLFQKRLVYKLNRNFERNLTARLAVRQPNIYHALNDDNPQLPCRRQKHCKGRFNGYVLLECALTLARDLAYIWPRCPHPILSVCNSSIRL